MVVKYPNTELHDCHTHELPLQTHTMNILGGTNAVLRYTHLQAKSTLILIIGNISHISLGFQIPTLTHRILTGSLNVK